MLFNSVKEINRLRKEINRLLSKEMPNIYYEVTIEVNNWSSQNFYFLGLTNCHHVSFGELQLTKTSLNFKTSCCNLRIRYLVAKLMMMMMMMMMKMMNCFCGMVDRRKRFSLIPSQDNCQRCSPSRIFDTPRHAANCVWLFYYFNFERDYGVLKSKSSCNFWTKI